VRNRVLVQRKKTIIGFQIFLPDLLTGSFLHFPKVPLILFNGKLMKFGNNSVTAYLGTVMALHGGIYLSTFLEVRGGEGTQLQESPKSPEDIQRVRKCLFPL
jgi:hypothetical protein